MPSSRASDRINASLSPLGEARALVAVLCAHLLALSEEREVRLPLSNSEHDIVARAAAVPEEEARRIAEDVPGLGNIGAARNYLARRFLGTTLAEKHPAAGIGLTEEGASLLAHALMYREAFLAALEGEDGRGAEEIRQRTLPLRLTAPTALLFAFAKMNAERFLSRLADSFTGAKDPLRLSLSADATPEDAYASVLSQFALIADRRSGRRSALAATLLRHAASEFARAPQGAARALRDAVRDALVAFSESEAPELGVVVAEEVRMLADAVVATALREGDAVGAARVAATPPATREEVRDAAKSLIIPEGAKRDLLAYIDTSHP